MDFDSIALFRLADRRLAWTGARQLVLAQNIANADTPGYKPRDLTPFSDSLTRATVQLARTDPAHIAPQESAGTAASRQKNEQAPDGNAVSLDVQLAQVAQTEQVNDLTSSLYTKYLGFFRTTLGK